MYTISDDEFRYENLWISEYYCLHWNFWEALRELVQNHIDAITMALKDKKLINVVPYGDLYKGPNYNLQYNFKFFSKNEADKKEYGSIEYNEDFNILRIQNIGNLTKADFLVGGKGTKGKIRDKEKGIIGKFGEGLKLAILVFTRLNKYFTIYSDGKQWTFKTEKDDSFKKDDGESIRCLKLSQSPDKVEGHKGKVIIEISPIDLNKEWIPYITRFLWLIRFQQTNINLGIVGAVENGKTEPFSEILLNRKLFGNKIYVKEIFVQEFDNTEGHKPVTSEECFYGFNVDLELDRDRNAIKNLDERNILFSKVIANIFRRRKELYCQLTDSSTKKWLENITNEIVDLLEQNYVMIRHITDGGNLGKEERNAIWRVLKYRYGDKDNNSDNKQFINCQSLVDLNKLLNDYKLPKDFYPYYENYIIPNWALWQALTDVPKCDYYIHWRDVFTNKISNAKDVDEPKELKGFLDEIFKIIGNNKNIKRDNIKFKKFEYDSDEIFYFKDDKLYLSESLKNSVNNKNKKDWIFQTICTNYKINILELISQNKIFTP